MLLWKKLRELRRQGYHFRRQGAIEKPEWNEEA
jgi:hypothetical protein